jgi:hypothetical protein
MTSAVLASVVWLLVAAASNTQQTKPDLSGTWQMDLSQSESAAQGEPIGPVTMVITQSATEIRIETTSRRGTIVDVYRFAAAAPSPGSAPEPGADAVRAAPTTPLPAIARWRGDTLLVDAVRDVRGQTITVQRAISLSANGKELIVESTMNVQHGYSISGARVYGTGKDVFVRRPSQ